MKKLMFLFLIICNTASANEGIKLALVKSIPGIGPVDAKMEVVEPRGLYVFVDGKRKILKEESNILHYKLDDFKTLKVRNFGSCSDCKLIVQFPDSGYVVLDQVNNEFRLE